MSIPELKIEYRLRAKVDLVAIDAVAFNLREAELITMTYRERLRLNVPAMCSNLRESPVGQPPGVRQRSD